MTDCQMPDCDREGQRNRFVPSGVTGVLCHRCVGRIQRELRGSDIGPRQAIRNVTETREVPA